jgi:uroporphyrinogen decarboxylase
MTMTSAQRVKTTLLHREPDRIPLDIGGSRVSGIHIDAYLGYRKRLGLPVVSHDLQIRYLQLPKIKEDFRSFLGVDIESVDPYTAAEETPDQTTEKGLEYTDRWNCLWLMPTDGKYYDIVRFPLADVQEPSDLKDHIWPAEDSPLIFDRMEKEADESFNIHQRGLVLGRTCPGIFEMLHILCGHEKALEDIAANPGLSEHIMDRILELKLTYYKSAIDRLNKAGVEFYIISESDDLGTQNSLLISPTMYRRLVKPRHAELFREIKKYSKGKAFIELHSCGAVREIIPDLIESGVEILNPVQVSAAGMDDTRSLKKDFGKDIVFHGGGVDSQFTLPYATPAEVKEEVKRRINDLADGGGFIFTPVHSIQYDVPFENFIAMIEAYKESVGS